MMWSLVVVAGSAVRTVTRGRSAQQTFQPQIVAQLGHLWLCQAGVFHRLFKRPRLIETFLSLSAVDLVFDHRVEVHRPASSCSLERSQDVAAAATDLGGMNHLLVPVRVAPMG